MQIKWMTDEVGFRIIDIEYNDVNGGSIAVTVSKMNSKYTSCDEKISQALRYESGLLKDRSTYVAFRNAVSAHRSGLRTLLKDAKAKGKKVSGLGASTKGNVILQYCGLSTDLISSIGEVNSQKFGCFTPGTWVPIVRETDVIADDPDYLLVLPWHFSKSFLERKGSFGRANLIFPLPKLRIV